MQATSFFAFTISGLIATATLGNAAWATLSQPPFRFVDSSSAGLVDGRLAIPETVFPSAFLGTPLIEAFAMGRAVRQGQTISINGRSMNARWLQWATDSASEAMHLGISDGDLSRALGVELLSSQTAERQPVAWFSQSETASITLNSRIIGQDRYLDILPLAQQAGWQVKPAGNTLQISSPSATIAAIREGNQAGGRRVVVALDRPIPWQVSQHKDKLAIALDATLTPQLQQSLASAPLQFSRISAEGNRTTLQVQVPEQGKIRVWSLANPPRIVIDSGATAMVDRTIHWAPGLQWREKLVRLGSAQFPVVWLEVDPTQANLRLDPIWRDRTQQPGIASLEQMTQRWQAVAAINGGFFNRNNQLPLGAIRRDGQWHSGPILNRGAIAWNANGATAFDRLNLQETLVTEQGQRFPILLLNSGYVKAGIARYTSAWGRTYSPLTDYEIILSVERDRIVQQQQSSKPSAGEQFLIPEDGYLLVFRAYKTAAAALPPGTPIRLERTTNPASFDQYPQILGAGPLLLKNRRIVLNPAAEQFSPAFRRQKASRSAIGKTAQGTLILAAFHQHPGGAGPTLAEAAQLMQSLGAIDALNLDGGSSTALYLGGRRLDRPNAAGARVHNGLGIFLDPVRIYR